MQDKKININKKGMKLSKYFSGKKAGKKTISCS